MIDLGKFDVVSGRLAVSDPCYDEDVWCRGELENAKNGYWLAFADEKVTDIKATYTKDVFADGVMVKKGKKSFKKVTV